MGSEMCIRDRVIEDADVYEEAVEELLEEDRTEAEIAEELEEIFDDLEELDEDTIEEFFDDVEEEQIVKLFESAPEVFNEASEEIKEEFEEEVNVFEGAFDDYVAAGSNITVEERRAVIAVTSTVAIARPAMPVVRLATPTIPTPPSASGPQTRGRRRT